MMFKDPVRCMKCKGVFERAHVRSHQTVPVCITGPAENWHPGEWVDKCPRCGALESIEDLDNDLYVDDIDYAPVRIVFEHDPENWDRLLPTVDFADGNGGDDSAMPEWLKDAIVAAVGQHEAAYQRHIDGCRTPEEREAANTGGVAFGAKSAPLVDVGNGGLVVTPEDLESGK